MQSSGSTATMSMAMLAPSTSSKALRTCQKIDQTPGGVMAKHGDCSKSSASVWSGGPSGYFPEFRHWVARTLLSECDSSSRGAGGYPRICPRLRYQPINPHQLEHSGHFIPRTSHTPKKGVLSQNKLLEITSLDSAFEISLHYVNLPPDETLLLYLLHARS